MTRHRRIGLALGIGVVASHSAELPKEHLMRIPLALVVVAALATSPAVAQTAAPANPQNTAPTAPAKSKPARKTTLIDINFATKAQLEALPQIGPARAAAIIKGRPYNGKDEFRKSKVIPANAYDAIKRKIVAGQEF